jgi:hypothetical protein
MLTGGFETEILPLDQPKLYLIPLNTFTALKGFVTTTLFSM